jgi:hypothetical protein
MTVQNFKENKKSKIYLRNEFKILLVEKKEIDPK